MVAANIYRPIFSVLIDNFMEIFKTYGYCLQIYDNIRLYFPMCLYQNDIIRMSIQIVISKGSTIPCIFEFANINIIYS